MPRPAHTTEQKRAIRNKIRAAASKLYKEKGAANISVRGVATEAGVSVGTVYSHFENLSDLLQSLWREPVRHLVNDMQVLASEIDCPEARLQALMLAHIEFAETNPSVYRNSFLFVRPETQAPPPQVELEQDRFFQLYESTIRAGQQSGVFRPGDSNELAQTVISAIHGSIALPINFHRLALDPSPKIPNLMVSAMLAWLASPRES